MRFLKRLVIGTLAVIGTLTVILVAVVVGFALTRGPAPLPSRMVLALDLDRGVADARPTNPFARLAPDRPYTVRDIVEALHAAAEDERVVSLLAHVSATELSMARAQEVRDAVAAFRASGKPAILFSESIGGFGGGTVEYYLASAFDEIWLQPSGTLALTGFMAESPFLREALDKLEIRPQFASRHEYKSAVDVLTQRKFTEEGEEATRALLEAWFAQMVEGVSAARGLAPERVRQLVDNAPLLASEALEAGLVDALGYRDEVEARHVGRAEQVDLAAYARRADGPFDEGTKIALIEATGTIQPGESRPSPFGSATMGARTVADAIAEAVEDPEVRAIVLRVSSPGGSYVASDTIWREVRRASDAGKPVVASMGNIAASGGYFISMAADRIVAQPGTITGSIGVFAGKLVLDGFWEDLGVNWDSVAIGANAPMWSANRPFPETAWKRLQEGLDAIYADFTQKAAEGRGMTQAEMDRVARGRIWSGADAWRVGLVDELGGFSTAIGAARALAGLPADAAVRLETYPKPKEPLEYLLNALADAPLIAAGADARLGRLGEALAPLLRQLPLGGESDVLRARPLVATD